MSAVRGAAWLPPPMITSHADIWSTDPAAEGINTRTAT